MPAVAAGQEVVLELPLGRYVVADLLVAALREIALGLGDLELSFEVGECVVDAKRRGVSTDVVIAELAVALPAESAGRPRTFSFAELGWSTSGRSAHDTDELLVDGFGRDRRLLRRAADSRSAVTAAGQTRRNQLGANRRRALERGRVWSMLDGTFAWTVLFWKVGSGNAAYPCERIQAAALR